VVGTYSDANWVTHGFLRAADGKITTIDDTAGGVGTSPASINDFGTIAGTVNDANNVSHGFFRTLDGKFTTFDVPAAVGGSIGTYSASINDFGVIAGFFNDAATSIYVGYIRSPEGKYTTFSPPQSGPYPYTGTFNIPRATLLGTATTGCIVDQNYVAYPFVWDAEGNTSTFEIPNQWVTPYYDLGACGHGINQEREIVGSWEDANGAYHGFLRLPWPRANLGPLRSKADLRIPSSQPLIVQPVGITSMHCKWNPMRSVVLYCTCVSPVASNVAPAGISVVVTCFPSCALV